jgi:hypothetical protein
MKGSIEIGRQSGELVNHTLETDIDETRLKAIVATITTILQDINFHMVENNKAMGELQSTTLKLDDHHVLSIVVTEAAIKANL